MNVVLQRSIEMLTVRQVADRLRCSASLVYALCSQGRLPHVRVGLGRQRGAIRIAETDLERFLEESRVERPSSSPLKLKHVSL